MIGDFANCWRNLSQDMTGKIANTARTVTCVEVVVSTEMNMFWGRLIGGCAGVGKQGENCQNTSSRHVDKIPPTIAFPQNNCNNSPFQIVNEGIGWGWFTSHFGGNYSPIIANCFHIFYPRKPSWGWFFPDKLITLEGGPPGWFLGTDTPCTFIPFRREIPVW